MHRAGRAWLRFSWSYDSEDAYCLWTCTLSVCGPAHWVFVDLHTEIRGSFMLKPQWIIILDFSCCLSEEWERQKRDRKKEITPQMEKSNECWEKPQKCMCMSNVIAFSSKPERTSEVWHHTFLTIAQVGSGFKKSHILIFSKYHITIASLASVKSCVTIGPNR